MFYKQQADKTKYTTEHETKQGRASQNQKLIQATLSWELSNSL